MMLCLITQNVLSLPLYMFSLCFCLLPTQLSFSPLCTLSSLTLSSLFSPWILSTLSQLTDFKQYLDFGFFCISTIYFFTLLFSGFPIDSHLWFVPWVGLFTCHVELGRDDQRRQRWRQPERGLRRDPEQHGWRRRPIRSDLQIRPERIG